MKQTLLERMERKLGRFAPKNLMLIIIIGTGCVWLLDFIVSLRSGYSIIQWLYFDREAILAGQVWRVITFVFIPEQYQLLWMALSLYFYWWIGSSLENAWGSFRFSAYYICGVLCAILGGFLTGFATNTYLNMSLFLAFAVLYPNQRIMLYFFIPIKVKWIGIVDAVLVAISFIFSNWTTRLFILLSLLNLLLFVWRIPINAMRAARRRRRWEREAKRPNSDDYPFDL